MYSGSVRLFLHACQLKSVAPLNSCCANWQGDPLDVAVCFAALCRALNIRARLVRSFWLGYQGSNGSNVLQEVLLKVANVGKAFALEQVNA